MKHLGDFDAATVIDTKFNTFRPSTGAAFTLAGSPAVSVYKDNSTTQSTSGVTLTVDFDAVTGLHHVRVDTSADGTFYSAGSMFQVVLTAGTVDSVSVAGTVIAEFSLRKSSALKPATSGRTLVVDAAGLADANTVKLGPSGSGAAQTARDVGGNVDATVSSRLASASYTAPLDAAGTRSAVGLASANLDTQIAAVKADTAAILDDTGTTGVVVGSIAANAINASAIATGALTNAKFAAGAIDAVVISTDAAEEIRDAVWAKTLSQLTGDPGATPTAAGAVMLPFMGIRNLRLTDSALGTDKIHNDAGAVILTASISDAASIFTKAKYA